MGVKYNVHRSRPDNPSSWIFEARISNGPLYAIVVKCTYNSYSNIGHNKFVLNSYVALLSRLELMYQLLESVH